MYGFLKPFLCNRAQTLEDVSPKGHFIYFGIDALHAIDSCVFIPLNV